jgi:hypothetical protein
MTLQTYLIQEMVYHWDVRSNFTDKISSTFGSNLVVPIVKIDFKRSYDKEARYLDLTYFFRTLAFQGSGEALAGYCFQKSETSRNGIRPAGASWCFLD